MRPPIDWAGHNKAPDDWGLAAIIHDIHDIVCSFFGCCRSHTWAGKIQLTGEFSWQNSAGKTVMYFTLVRLYFRARAAKYRIRATGRAMDRRAGGGPVTRISFPDCLARDLLASDNLARPALGNARCHFIHIDISQDTIDFFLFSQPSLHLFFLGIDLLGSWLRIYNFFFFFSFQC